jgi:hypothetical protein
MGRRSQQGTYSAGITCSRTTPSGGQTVDMFTTFDAAISMR